MILQRPRSLLNLGFFLCRRARRKWFPACRRIQNPLCWFLGSFEPLIIQHNANPKEINFGKISVSINLPTGKHIFKGPTFMQKSWDSIPRFILLHILDYRQVGYSDKEIADIWDLPSIPPSDEIYTRLQFCSICTALGIWPRIVQKLQAH